MKWARKPKILLVADSARIHTGFGRVANEVGRAIYETGQYELSSIRWFDRPTGEFVPFPIIQTSRKQREQDKYSTLTFPKVVEAIEPDLVLSIGDEWMVNHIGNCPQRSNFKWVSYVPIDGAPVPKHWPASLGQADELVMYTQFAKAAIAQRDPALADRCSVISHGVDCNTFKPLEKDVAKEKLGFSKDDFIIGCVARNQPRKYLPRLLKAFAAFVKPKDGEEKKNVKLYMHMAIKDCGWDLQDLIERFNLREYVVFTGGLKIGVGLTSEMLNVVYNSFDIHTVPTSGEGFGLPIAESLACGVPNVVTDWFAHKEFCHMGSELIPVGDFITEPQTNIERALVDLDGYVAALNKLYDSESIRQNLAVAGRSAMEKLDWPIINSQWIQLINKTLNYNGSVSRRKLKIVRA